MKRFFLENRVFVILMGVVLVCFIAILTMLFIYFYKGTDTNSYGNRLDGIKEVEISSKTISDYEKELKDDEKISNATINIKGKIIYISLIFENETELIEAEGKATKFLEKFSEKEKSFYDFQLYLKTIAEKGFIISGAKNKNNATIIWNNNVPVE